MGCAATTIIMMSDITSHFMIPNGYDVILKIYEKQRLLIAMRPKMRSSDVLTLYALAEFRPSVRIHGQRIVGKIDVAQTCRYHNRCNLHLMIALNSSNDVVAAVVDG